MGTIFYLNNEARVYLRTARQRAAEAERLLYAREYAGAELWLGMAQQSLKDGLQAASDASRDFPSFPHRYGNSSAAGGGYA